MKKNRPGVLLTVLCEASMVDLFAEQMLRETSAFGVRRQIVERRKLRRHVVQAKTSFGEIEVKVGTLNGEVLQAAPEFESCKAAAARHGVRLSDVYRAAEGTVEGARSAGAKSPPVESTVKPAEQN